MTRIVKNWRDSDQCDGMMEAMPCPSNNNNNNINDDNKQVVTDWRDSDRYDGEMEAMPLPLAPDTSTISVKCSWLEKDQVNWRRM